MKPSSFQFVFAHLRVASLARAQSFYVDILGLHASSTPNGELALHPVPGAPALLILSEIPGLGPALENGPGLFHLALLVPERADLARVLRRLAAHRYPLQGLSDHSVSEALYLADPDGNGLELYVDRPRDAWPRKQGQLAMFTRPLDVPNLLSSAPDDQTAGLPVATTLGHVHLRVENLAAAERFATGELGLAVTTRAYPGAVFFAADGYHHHLATNTWGVTAPDDRSTPRAGLDSVQAEIEDLSTAHVAQGPAGIRFELQPAAH